MDMIDSMPRKFFYINPLGGAGRGRIRPGPFREPAASAYPVFAKSGLRRSAKALIPSFAAAVQAESPKAK